MNAVTKGCHNAVNYPANHPFFLIQLANYTNMISTNEVNSTDCAIHKHFIIIKVILCYDSADGL